MIAALDQRVRRWVCPQHEDSSLEACVGAGCHSARLAAAAPDLLAVLTLIVKAHHEKDSQVPFGAWIRRAREVIDQASVPGTCPYCWRDSTSCATEPCVSRAGKA